MSKQFLIAIVVSILALLGIYTLTSKKDAPAAKSSSSTNALSNNVTGKNTKKVTLVEYGDFQCPACGQYHPLIKQIIEKYQNDIQFQFRNFPLQQIHPNARVAARAAEAAGKQGKYWEMHNLLYDEQDSWKASTAANTIFEGYASQLGLNLEKYKTDFASDAVNQTIIADYAEGTKLGVDSTPSFFLQGKKITNPQTLAEFEKLIDTAIANSSKTK